MEAIILKKAWKISDEDLKRINELTDKIIKMQKDYALSYLFIEHALKIYMENNKFIITRRKIESVKPLKKWEIISLALDYFKSIDEEFYKVLNDIVLGQNSKIKINIYKMSEIKDCKQEDIEFNDFRKYKKSPLNNRKHNRIIIYMPLNHKWKNDKKDSSECLEKDEGTLDDVYTLVHELSHIFDLYLDYIIKEDGRTIISKIVCNNYLFTESTAIGFERFLVKYLLENRIINDKKDAEYEYKMRANDTINKCYLTYARLVLARKKEEKNYISSEDIDEITEAMGLDYNEKTNLINVLLKNQEEVFLSDAGYAFSGIISPTIEELLNNRKIDDLKKYMYASRMGDFKGALNAIGIELSRGGLEKLKKTMIKNRYEFEQREEQR